MPAMSLLEAARAMAYAYDLQEVTDAEYPELGALRRAIAESEAEAVTQRAKFSEQTHELVAVVLRNQLSGDTLWAVVTAFANAFEADNPAFDRDRFFRACRQ